MLLSAGKADHFFLLEEEAAAEVLSMSTAAIRCSSLPAGEAALPAALQDVHPAIPVLQELPAVTGGPAAVLAALMAPAAAGGKTTEQAVAVPAGSHREETGAASTPALAGALNRPSRVVPI